MGIDLNPFDSGNSWSQAAQAVGNFASSLVGDLSSAANTVLALIYTLSWNDPLLDAVYIAIQTGFDPSKLGAALAQDWQHELSLVQAAGEALTIIVGGEGQVSDYTRFWNLITDNGNDVNTLLTSAGKVAQSTNTLAQNLLASTPSLPQQPPRSSDPAGDLERTYQDALSQTGNPVPEMRDAAQYLFDHGWYTEGNAVLAAWRNALVDSPLGATFKTASALASKDPLLLATSALELTAAMNDTTVQNTWATNKWGSPKTLFPTLIASLNAAWQKLTRASVATLPKAAAPPPPASPASKAVKAVAVGAAGAAVAGLAWWLLFL